MTDTIDPGIPAFDILLDEKDLQARVDALAKEMAPRLSKGDWTAIVILLGATPFASDLLKALARLGVDIGFDALWLQSYGDERETSGRVLVRADILRPITGRGVLLIDDVYDTGKTLAFARKHLMAKGARETMTAVFARKPDAEKEGLDHWAYDAPPRYLVGYGMDDAGKYRGLPYLGAVPEGQ